MLSMLRSMGIRSEHAYMGGFASIGLSMIAWMINLGKTQSKPQADRWGLFVGEWAPTFFAVGVALKLDEMSDKK